jgi:hypothetical protein
MHNEHRGDLQARNALLQEQPTEIPSPCHAPRWSPRPIGFSAFCRLCGHRSAHRSTACQIYRRIAIKLSGIGCGPLLLWSGASISRLLLDRLSRAELKVEGNVGYDPCALKALSTLNSSTQRDQQERSPPLNSVRSCRSFCKEGERNLPDLLARFWDFWDWAKRSSDLLL